MKKYVTAKCLIKGVYALSTVDIGISLNIESNGDKNVEYIVIDCIKNILSVENVKFTSIYLYDDETDIGWNPENLEKAFNDIYQQKLFNQILAESSNAKYQIQLSVSMHSLNILIAIEYEDFINLISVNNESRVIDILEDRIKDLYLKNKYEFCFAGCDSEFDFSYEELLNEEECDMNSYSILAIEKGGMLKIYHSGYNLLGIPTN